MTENFDIPCGKCIVSDAIDGYGRCTGCNVPPPSKERIQEILYFWERHRILLESEGKQSYP